MVKELVDQRKGIEHKILSCIESDIIAVKIAAENMVECATDIKGQGYSCFMQSRETFMETVEKLHDHILRSLNIDTHH